jgi:hypothetical protein
MDIAELREFDLTLSQRSADFFSFEAFTPEAHCLRVDHVMWID